MRVSKKQLIILFAVLALVILAGIIFFVFKIYFKTGADTTTGQEIKVNATVEYKDGETTSVVSSGNLAIQYESVAIPTLTVNIENNQTITTNPFIITAKASQTDLISKVEFYIDNNLICTTTLPDVEGYFDCEWNTAKYHSVVKVVAYDIYNRTQEVVLNTTVSLPGGGTGDPGDTNDPNVPNNPSVESKPLRSVLPKTGSDNNL